jgi:hypothetical protein
MMEMENEKDMAEARAGKRKREEVRLQLDHNAEEIDTRLVDHRQSAPHRNHSGYIGSPRKGQTYPCAMHPGIAHLQFYRCVIAVS